MAPDTTGETATIPLWRRAARVMLLLAIAIGAVTLAAENTASYLALRSAEARGALDDPAHARQLYSAYWYGRPGPVRAGDDLRELIEGEVGFQAPSVLAGLLIRELAGDEPVEYVIAPSYKTAPRPNLVVSTVKSLTWGKTEGYTYDAVISDEQFLAWRDTWPYRLAQYPFGVYVLAPRTLPVSKLVIHTDPAGSRIYIVPAEDSPIGYYTP